MSPVRPLFDLVAVDLDGTLLHQDDTIGLASQDALQRLKQLGVPVVVCTGRGPRDLAPVSVCLNESDYRVLVNGALIYENGKPAIIRGIEPELLQEALGFFHSQQHDALLQDWQGQRFAESFRYPNSAWDQVLPAVQRRVSILERFPEVFEQPVIRISSWNGEKEVLEFQKQIRLRFGERFNMYYFQYTFWVLEMLHPLAAKAHALEWITGRLGIRRDRVLAFGDGPNDVEMLRWAGMGVAMDNAAPEARQAARRIAPSNEDDGFATIIQEYFQ